MIFSGIFKPPKRSPVGGPNGRFSRQGAGDPPINVPLFSILLLRAKLRAPKRQTTLKIMTSLMMPPADLSREALVSLFLTFSQSHNEMGLAGTVSGWSSQESFRAGRSVCFPVASVAPPSRSVAPQPPLHEAPLSRRESAGRCGLVDPGYSTVCASAAPSSVAAFSAGGLARGCPCVRWSLGRAASGGRGARAKADAHLNKAPRAVRC